MCIICYTFLFPDGFPNDLTCFKNKCLLTSFIFGYFQYEKFNPLISDEQKKDKMNLTTYDRLLKLTDKHGKIQRNIAGAELKKILLEMCKNVNISMNGPHDFSSVLTNLAEYFKCQIHLIQGSEEKRASYESFPKEYDDSLPQIFLFNSDKHVMHICNLKKFFRDNRFICFYCRGSFSSLNGHKCKKNFCKECHLPLASSQTKVLPYLPFRYCDKLIKENINKKCSKCLQIIQTDNCYTNHLKKCEWKKKQSQYSKLGRVCENCSRFISFKNNVKGGEKRSPEQILSLHKCYEPDQKPCRHCRELKPISDEKHCCKVQKTELTKIWPNLIFFHFEYRDLSSINCEQCKNLKLNYLKTHNSNMMQSESNNDKSLTELVCENHAKNYKKELIPNVAVIWREKERGVFEEYVLLEDYFGEEEKEPCDILKFEYFTNENVQPYVKTLNQKGQDNPKETCGFSNILATKLNNVKKTIIYKFIQLVTQDSWRNSTLISWNDQVSHLSEILEALISLGANALPFQKKRKLYSVQLEKHNIKFINACNFFNGSLYDVASQFEIKVKKRFFPNWNKYSYFHYNGSFPALSDFLNIADNASVETEKKLYWEQNCHIQDWCFKTEIVSYAKHCTEILAKCCLQFLKQTFELQERIKKLENIDSPLILHPFSKNINSRSSFTFNIHKAFYLNKYDLESVMFEKTSNMKNVSLGEYQYVSFKELTEPENGWRHAFNSKSGQKKFGNYHVDLFSEKLNIAINVNGCLYHYHEPCTAKINLNRTPTTKNFLGQTAEEQQKWHQQFVDFMAKHFPSVKLEFMNGCDWYRIKRIKEENGKTMWYNFKKKYKGVYWDKRPLKRLIPREAIRSGGLEVYNLMYEKSNDLNKDEDIYFCDINSLYSHVALKTQFGIGKLEILIHPNELSNVFFNFVENQFYYYDAKLERSFQLEGGAAFCKVLVPSDTLYPFLPYRLKNGNTIMACCRTCAEKKLTKRCCHPKESRMFTGCWMISTLNQLRSEGYEITFLEIHYFMKKDYLLKDYVQLLCSERLKNSGVINDSMTTEEKQRICDEINLTMELPDPLKLRPNECVNNPGKKESIKFYMNCLFGMYSRNTNDIETKPCNSQDDINKIAKTYKIVNVNILSDKECHVDYVLNSNAIPPNKDCNIYIGGEVASQAFVELRKHLLTVLENGAVPLQIDTDCIVFKMPKNKPNPLKIGPSVGLWKHEYRPGSIEQFYAFASRNYAVCFKNKNDVMQQVLKIRGLCLRTSFNHNVINCDTYKNFISQYFKKNMQSIKLSQIKRFTDSKTFQYCFKMSSFNFSNTLTSKRFLLTDNVEKNYKESILKKYPNELYNTYPFGFRT